MKLYNKTKCPDEILQPLLIAAGKSIGARTGKVVVKVTQGQHHRSKGQAHDCPLVRTWHLSGRKRKNRAYKKGYVQTDGGYIELTLPGRADTKRLDLFGGAESLAERFYKMAQHEWAHIKDFQQRICKATPRTPSGRRIAWEDRPCEMWAQKQVKSAKLLPGIDDMILELALWLEEPKCL